MQHKHPGTMIPHDMFSVCSLNTVLVLLAGFVAWRVSLYELYNTIEYRS